MSGGTPIAEAIGHRFRDPVLLQQALTHRSHSQTHNERLEFMGDAVLGCAIAAELFRRHPDLPEGDLSRMRASLVSQSALADRAAAIRLHEHLRLGAGELNSGGLERPSILADAMEAVIGAVFLDAGYEAAAAVVARVFGPVMDGAPGRRQGKDPKTALQEWLQGRRRPLPEYRVLAVTGEAHRQQFEVECAIGPDGPCATGAGASRRSAEQAAAQAVLDQIQRRRGAA